MWHMWNQIDNLCNNISSKLIYSTGSQHGHIGEPKAISSLPCWGGEWGEFQHKKILPTYEHGKRDQPSSSIGYINLEGNNNNNIERHKI